MKTRLVTLLAFSFSLSAQYLAPTKPGPSVPLITPSPQDVLSQLMNSTSLPMYLRAGDLIAIQVYSTNINLSVRVEEDGSITLPLLGRIGVSQMTAGVLQEVISKKLVEGGFVLDPQVTVVASAQPSQVVVVSGEVNRPGSFPAFGRHTLGDYLSQSQGLKPNASWVITLQRPGFSEPINVPVGPNPASSRYSGMPVFAGDEIKVSTSGVFYVLGAVKAEGAFPLNPFSPVTAFQALSLAGGVGFQANRGSAYIVRSEDSKRVVISVDLAAIIKGKKEDIALRADDILYVPTSKLKAALKSGGAGYLISVSNALLYNRVF